MEKKEIINLTFPNAEGNDISLSDFRGKVVYIDIWATWCGPCKKEMPAMKALEAEYKDNKDIVFMGISVDASKNIQKWKDFVIKEQLPGVQLFAGDMAGPALSKPYKITGIPRFMLVGKGRQSALYGCSASFFFRDTGSVERRIEKINDIYNRLIYKHFNGY